MADIPAKLVKELRDKTNAGFGDCKKALEATDGDMEKAMEWLRQKGITSAEKKAGKITAEGLVGSYIHTGGRVGVLVEVNCQTDFVARNEAFQALVKDIAMQIAACPNVEYVRVEDIPPDVVAKEKEIEMGRDDLSNKPDNVREKIVMGRIEKRLKELSLLEQPYIKDQSITVAELIKQRIASLGENIQVRRFVRFVMGEGIDKQETDFAAEVAAQTGVQEAPTQEAPAAAPEAPPVAEPEVTSETQPEPKTEIKSETKSETKPDSKEKDKKKKKK
ncbi:MAG: translation elongation factor Ts [Synechococcales cyanobacterium C42_A2020_086]|jgi:elongation factor Ts|nr:translation elongation factor Ts [Synechococcales cyanobacterium C42_A2020_086]